jgi:hypothetical protein
MIEVFEHVSTLPMTDAQWAELEDVKRALSHGDYFETFIFSRICEILPEHSVGLIDMFEEEIAEWDRELEEYDEATSIYDLIDWSGRYA